MSKTINTTEALLRAFAHSVGELDLANVDVRASINSGGQAEMRVEAQNQKALVQIHPQLHPSRKILNIPRASGDAPFITVSPHIPDELAADYRKAAINHGDLNGRLFIQTPGLILDREPKVRLYRNLVVEPDLFSSKASRIVRAFLSHRDRSWSQDDLAGRTLVSRGLVSRILATLIRQGYVTQESRASRQASAIYRLADFDQLLDAWKADDDWGARSTVQRYSLLTTDAGEIADTVRKAIGETNGVFTQWFAMDLRHLSTTLPIISAYVANGRSLPESRFVRPALAGGNLWLITPEDEGVFIETQECDGFRLVSDVQIYLDLVQMGQRGLDAAKALRAWEGFAR